MPGFSYAGTQLERFRTALERDFGLVEPPSPLCLGPTLSGLLNTFAQFSLRTRQKCSLKLAKREAPDELWVHGGSGPLVIRV